MRMTARLVERNGKQNKVIAWVKGSESIYELFRRVTVKGMKDSEYYIERDGKIIYRSEKWWLNRK